VGVNPANIDVYRTALAGLNTEQSVFALVSKGATDEQIRQILVTEQSLSPYVEVAIAKAGLTTATDKLTYAEILEIAATNKMSKANAESILSKLGITAMENGQVAIKQQLTLSMLEQAVASKKLTAAEAEQMAAIFGLSAVETTNIGITNVLTACFSKLWGVITSHPIGAILTAVGAVAIGVISYINKANEDAKKALVEAHDNAKKALDNSLTDLTNDKSELQSITGELDSIKGKIKELASQDKITLTDKNEIAQLSKLNSELEAQKIILENNIKLKQKNAAHNAKELLDTETEMTYSTLDGNSISTQSESHTYAEHAKYQASNLKNSYNLYMNALDKGDVNKLQSTQELIDVSSGDIASLTSELLEITNSFKADDGSIVEGYEDLYKEYTGMIYNLQSLTDPNVFLDLAKTITKGTDIDYDKVIADANNLAFNNDFSIDKLDQDFVKALADNGIDESTISYIFSLKQHEFQSLIDKIDKKYDSSYVQSSFIGSNDIIDHDYAAENKAKEEIDKVNQELTEYAKQNPINFMLISSYDSDFSKLDNYMEEEKEKAENNADYEGNYVSNAINKLYEEAKLNNSDFDTSASTISKTISLISSQLKPQFDALSDAYQKIFTPDGFTKENIDNDMLENLRSTFSNLDESLGISFDTSELEDFFSILTNSKSTSEQVQKAFNDLATSYLYSTDVMDQLNETTADSIEKQLEEMGVSNAQALVAEALNFKNQELIASKQYLAQEGSELSKATGSEIAKFGEEQLAANNCSEALALFYLQKSLLNSKVISSDEDINNILRLAEAAGVTSSSLALLQSAKADYNRAIEMGDDAAAQRAEQRVLRASEQLKQDVANLKPHVNVNTGNTSASNNVKSAGTASKEDTDPHVTAFEEQYKKLKDIRDRDKISQKQYLDVLRAMYERYYKGQDKYIDEYNKYQKEYLDGMLDLYKSVISGVVKQIDKHIKSLNVQKDSAVDSLKSQQESAKKALEAQKDAIEDQIKLIDKQIDSKQAQIDAINEENEARENAINLEKEQYELERLRNQRTEFVYSGKEKGFIYQTDSGAIRDQEQAVKEAEDQIRIANIEKEISLLEKKKEVLEEQQSAIDDQIDQVDAYYEELISNTESYWDTQIKGAEDVKSRWEELQDLKEQLELNVQLISMGISPDDISQLTSEELFEKVKEHYLGILADISSGNSQMLSSLSDLAGVDVSDLPSFLEETHGYMEKLSEGIDFANLDDSLSTVIDQFENVAAAAGMMTGSVIGSTGVSVGTDKSTKSSPGGSASGNVSFIDAVKSLEDESVPMLNNVADAFAGEESSDNSSQSIAGSVNKAKEAIAGSSSGKKKSSEGQEGSGEDSGSLLEAMSAQSKAALDEETGIPAQIQKWQELNGVLSNILENLRNIAAVIPTLNSDTNISAPGASAAGLAAAKGGVSNGARNVLVSEYNQLETIIHKNGTYEITSSPTLTDLRPGDQVLNNSQTLSLIRKKNRAAANRSNGLFIGNSLSPLPELQLRNTVLDHSFASPTAPQFLSNDNRNSLVNVSIGDVILENVQNADALSRQIVMRLPTQIKQELSKRG